MLGYTPQHRAFWKLIDLLTETFWEASRTGIIIDAARLPLDPAAAAWFAGRGMDALDASVGAGDDYELLFVIPPKGTRRLEGVRRLLRGLPLTRIGELTRAADMVLIRDGRPGLLPSGFSHF